jgi:hypothetical protein
LLDEEVYKLGEVDWEYGPNGDNGFYFSLSPNLRFDLIAFTDFAVSLSPNIPKWKFVSGKPQKPGLIEEFSFINNDGTKTIVNTKNWYAVVYEFKDNTYDIDFILSTNLDMQTSYLALDIAMVNLLGEINYMRKVENVKIVKEFDSATNGKGVQFAQLEKIII